MQIQKQRDLDFADAKVQAAVIPSGTPQTRTLQVWRANVVTNLPGSKVFLCTNIDPNDCRVIFSDIAHDIAH